ncbi:MAG: mechanosensitive ion channel [Ahrensia sp.]|nr:mechanosensitive ion channel [Ahrensia sp.]
MDSLDPAKLSGLVLDLGAQALEWAQSPAAWSQVALLAVAFVAAWFLRRSLEPVLTKILTPAEGSRSILASIRRFILLFLPLLLPLLAFAFTSIGEQATRAAFGSGAIIAFGKRSFLALAVWIFATRIIYDPFLKLFGRYVLIPAAGLYLFGLLGPVSVWLEGLTFQLGNISFSASALVRGAIVGSLLFWLGRWSNSQSGDFIRRNDEMRPATRELAAKATELAIFGAVFLMILNVMGINLSALAVVGGAIGVGLGFGLQKIASNFISGIILLLEGQATVGDFVELDGGEAGTIVQMNARATILETFDGRWIVVPNEDFIVTRVTNYSDAGSAKRYEVPFSVSYDSDVNMIPDIIETAVAKHPDVLEKPFPPDCELRAFGDHGVEFAVEFWVNGLDDGANKFTSDVHFLVWNALRDNNITIPYPHLVLKYDGPDGALAAKQEAKLQSG